MRIHSKSSASKLKRIAESVLIGTGLAGWMQEPVFYMDLPARIYMALVGAGFVYMLLTVREPRE